MPISGPCSNQRICPRLHGALPWLAQAPAGVEPRSVRNCSLTTSTHYINLVGPLALVKQLSSQAILNSANRIGMLGSANDRETRSTSDSVELQCSQRTPSDHGMAVDEKLSVRTDRRSGHQRRYSPKTRTGCITCKYASPFRSQRPPPTSRALQLW